MLKLLLAFFLFQTVHCFCPIGFDLVSDGQCRGFYAPADMYEDEAATMAVALCKTIQGQPIIIHNDEQYTYWQRRISAPWTTIGLLCNSITKQWVWADGSPLDYIPPVGFYNGELNQACKEGLAWVMRPDGYWSYLSGHVYWKGADIFCTTQLKQVVPVSNSCERFGDDSDDGVCYQVGDIAENWQDAQFICRMLGADLASIHNLQENSFIRRLAVSKGAVGGVFLGGKMWSNGTDWELENIDGSDWDFENFKPGFPRDGFGECIAMDTSTAAGDWINTDCSSKLPVACIRDPITIIAPDAICGQDTWREGQIITSPGFPFSASLACEFWLTVDPGKRVEVNIKLLEANSCCDTMIIYEGSLAGNVMASLTGQERDATYTTTASNIVRVVWQPNGGVNVLGLVMTFRAV